MCDSVKLNLLLAVIVVLVLLLVVKSKEHMWSRLAEQNEKFVPSNIYSKLADQDRRVTDAVFRPYAMPHPSGSVPSAEQLVGGHRSYQQTGELGTGKPQVLMEKLMTPSTERMWLGDVKENLTNNQKEVSGELGRMLTRLGHINSATNNSDKPLMEALHGGSALNMT